MALILNALMNLPAEMRALPQWAVAGANKAPMSIDSAGKLFNASVTRPSEWMEFDRAVQLAVAHQEHVTTHVDRKGRTITKTGFDIGFILHEDDPFTCIDLDVKDASNAPEDPELWTTPTQIDLYWSIIQRFDSYSERSRSGKGCHVWLEGNIGKGFRRDGVEIYSQERFIISTGDIIGAVPKPVKESHALLANMVTQMRPVPTNFHLEELPAEDDDWVVLERAFEASNSDKFTGLWRGQWEQMGFPSQSEADLALMSMLTFYSKSNDQCRRMFRDSVLGKREKAVKDDRYVNLTLSTIREREHREGVANLKAIKQSVEQFHAAQQQAPTPPARDIAALHTADQPSPPVARPPSEVTLAQLTPVSQEILTAGETGLPWPPGLAGALAYYMYRSAIRPVKEVAIVAALGLLSGLCGKAWHIPKSGLNLYIILVARSAVGKEAMHQGIAEVIKACEVKSPGFHKYVDFTEYASGPALIKACVGQSCFVNVCGEWGRRLRRLAQDDRDSALQTLRTQMTNLYQKSGPSSILGGIGYSNQDSNIQSISGVSYSMIGETTPGTFYEALTEGMMEDGFLSRCLIISYDGPRPEPNDRPAIAPDAQLVQALINISTQADLMTAQDYSMPVLRDDEAGAIINAFSLECDAMINLTNDEARRQMWNRAALKALRIAANLAVAQNWMQPCIRLAEIEWAILVVRADIKVMQTRLESGDVGSGDDSRERKLSRIMRDYLAAPVAKSYKIKDEMRQNSIVPRGYLQTRIQSASSFYSHKLGRNRALDDTLQSMVSSGILIEVQKDKVIDAYGYFGRAYRILRLDDYND